MTINYWYKDDLVGINSDTVSVSIDDRGYLRVSDKDSVLYNKRIHRVIGSLIVGRSLLPTEHVHHIDFNKLNNNPDNLQVLNAKEHKLLHNTYMVSSELLLAIDDIIINETSPISDSKIVVLLEKQDIKVARRTVAKYRAKLGYPPASKR